MGMPELKSYFTAILGQCRPKHQWGWPKGNFEEQDICIDGKVLCIYQLSLKGKYAGTWGTVTMRAATVSERQMGIKWFWSRMQTQMRYFLQKPNKCEGPYSQKNIHATEMKPSLKLCAASDPSLEVLCWMALKGSSRSEVRASRHCDLDF